MHLDNFKPSLDTASVAITVATLLNWLPYIAAGASLAWSLIRIYETKTFQKWARKIKKAVKK